MGVKLSGKFCQYHPPKTVTGNFGSDMPLDLRGWVSSPW